MGIISGKFFFTGRELVIYIKILIEHDKIVCVYIDKNTPEGHHTYRELDYFIHTFGEDFLHRHREMFLSLKHNMSLMGIYLDNKTNWRL